jgi:GT2 family glycosyltransferase
VNDTGNPLSISVVIPTHDEPERLRAALLSLSAQQYSTKGMEIIVVDDASSRCASGSLHTAASPFSLKLIRHETNQGRARARNTGLRAATGELIVFLDSDMTVGPDFLQAHASLHRNQANIVAIGNINFAPQIPPNCMTRYIESRGVHRLTDNQVVPFKCFVTGNSSMRRDLLLKAGLFDENFTAYGGEDLELGYRLHQLDAVFRYAPDALSWHHHLRSLDQFCQLMHSYGRQSLPILLTKHPELARLLRTDFLEEFPLSPRRLFLNLALSGIVYRPIQALVQKTLKYYVPGLFFDYLWWYNRTRGYLEAVG